MVRTKDNTLVSLKSAAQLLGNSRSGLQKIVDNSRKGSPPPLIRFLQTKKWGRIKFHPEWIDEFIETNSVAHGGTEWMPVKRKPSVSRAKSGPKFEVDLSRLEEWPG